MEIKNLVQIHWKEIKKESIIFYPSIKENFCERPYPNHPKGCPNIDKCEEISSCYMDFLENLLSSEFKTFFYIIYAEFDFERYLYLKREEWTIKGKKITEAKLRNLIWWQGSVKSKLKEYLEILFKNNQNPFFVWGCGSGFDLSFQENFGSMEHACINVFSTMKLNGVRLEIHPKKKVFLCTLVASKEPINYNLKKQLNLEKFIEN